MPHFFQFSRNGRKVAMTGKKKTVKKPNASTMNRICEIFSHIGKINMNFAGVPVFNWKMLLTGPVGEFNEEAVALFCEMDASNISNTILSCDYVDMGEVINTAGYDMICDAIVDEMTRRYGSLEAVYPSIVKWLFTGENAEKKTHKQMFWRVFGDLVVSSLESNLIANTVCDSCGMMIPIWDETHNCPKVAVGFIRCADCGELVQRNGGTKQKRCEACQNEYRKLYHRVLVRRSRRGVKKDAERKNTDEV